MANICDNKFYFACKSNFQEYVKKFNNDKIEGEFEIVGEDSDGGGCLEGYIDSNWTFPREIMEEILPDKEEDPDECYFRCLSEEYGCGYVAMNIYSDGHWRSEQCFDL